MRLLFVIGMLYSGSAFAQAGLYQVKLKTLDNQSAGFDSYQGKKILVASSSISDLRNGVLSFLDSIQTANPKIVVVVIPTYDASDSLGDQGSALTNNLRVKNAILTTPTLVGNGARVQQNNFFEWFSANRGIMHFDPVISRGTRYMVISESGILYAMLEKDVSATILNEIIQQGDIKK